jgi:hypothetical protein
LKGCPGKKKGQLAGAVGSGQLAGAVGSGSGQ